MTFYLKGNQNYYKSKLKIPKKSAKVECLNLQTVVVLMPLEVECHTVPHLKALTCGIEHRSGHGLASIFRWQKISLKSTHFTS